MVSYNSPQPNQNNRRQPAESILYVHPEKGEQIWDVFYWNMMEENYGTGEPSLVTMSSKRHSDHSLDMKLVFTNLPEKTQRIADWHSLPYHEYVRIKALMVLEWGTSGLKKAYLEGRPHQS